MSKNQNSKLKSQNYKRILIVRLDKVGDVVLSTPVIRAVREAYPRSYIAFMVQPYASDIVKDNPYLNEVITYDKEGSEKDLDGNLTFIENLHRKRFDIAIILHPTARTHIVTFFAGIPERVGYDRKMGILLTKRIPHTKQFGLKHEIDYTLDILRYIGIEAEDRTLYMSVNKESERKIADIFEDNAINDDDLVMVINPAASCPSKRWSPENFARLADALISKYGAKVIIISDSKDKSFADKVTSTMESLPINLGGMTTVGDLASIFKRSKLLISNDSGPVHIACAMGTPVVAIFGRSDRGLSPMRWGPSGRNDIVLHKDVGCDECLAHNCKIGFKCLEAVTVEEVLVASENILGTAWTAY